MLFHESEYEMNAKSYIKCKAFRIQERKFLEWCDGILQKSVKRKVLVNPISFRAYWHKFAQKVSQVISSLIFPLFFQLGLFGNSNGSLFVFCLSFRMLNTKCFLDEWAWTRPLKSWTQTQSRQPLQSAVSSFRKRLASIQVKTFTFWNALFIEWKYQVFYQKLWKLSLKASKSNSIVIIRNSLL